MYEFHLDKDRYFDMQYRVTKEYILPFLNEHVPEKKWNRVLEIGCAEAGVLKAFVEEGAFCTGIELSEYRIANAAKYHEEALLQGRIEFINRDIFDIDPVHDLGGTYDLIILKDVIEHIPGQCAFMAQLPSFLSEGGFIFFAFPPWQMPYGGHQQICRNKFFSKLPYSHLLPGFLYNALLKLGGESPATRKELMEVKSTGISIERFEHCLRINKFRVVAKRYYLFNPIYRFKFGIKPRKQVGIVSAVPVVRNFLVTASYYLIQV